MPDVIKVAELPEHIDVVAKIGEAAPTPEEGVKLTVVAVPAPQEFTPIQTIVPEPEPIATFSVPVALDPLQPVPVTLQL